MSLPDNLKILVVDDGKITRKIIQSFLTELGYSAVQTVADGVEALEELRAAISNGNPYDLALLDINMPRMNGIEVLQEINQDKELNKLKVIMQTAGSDVDIVLQACKLGAAAYIVKPVTQKNLQEKIGQTFGTKTS